MAQLRGRLKLSDAERGTLGEIGHGLGRKALAEVATVARPDTILAWYHKLVARKFDGTQVRCAPGRPRLKREVEQLIVRVASENRDWGYDRKVVRDSTQVTGSPAVRDGVVPALRERRRQPISMSVLRCPKFSTSTP